MRFTRPVGIPRAGPEGLREKCSPKAKHDKSYIVIQFPGYIVARVSRIMEHAYAYTDAQLWGFCAVLSAGLGIRTIPAVNALGLHAFRSGRDVGDRLGWIGVAALFLALRCLAGAT